MKLTREVDIYQCPVSTKYCFLSFRRLEPNTVQMADYVRVWHGEIELDDAPEELVEMDIQKAICEKCFCRFQNGQDKTFFGRSITTSDIISVKKDNTVSYYYCDFVGWKLIRFES